MEVLKVGEDVLFRAFLGRGADDDAAVEGMLFAKLAHDGPKAPAFFAAGGGYLCHSTNGTNFLRDGGQLLGLTVTTAIPPGESSDGESGILRWLNEGADSVITGAYPAEDTAIVDPPSWYSAVPASLSVDARLPATDFFLAGMWHLDEPQSASAPGSPIIVHGTNAAGTARLTTFANNPLYRADPEREWPMVGAAAYWADQ